MAKLKEQTAKRIYHRDVNIALQQKMTNNTSDDPVGSINISADEPLETAEPEYTIEPKENGAERRILNNGSSSRLKWLLPLPFLLFLVYLAAGYFGVPLCRAILSDKLGVYLDRPVTVGGAGFNPLTLNLTLRNSIIGPRLSDPDDPVDPVLSFAELEANIDISSLFRRKLVCSHFKIEQLFFHLVRNHDDTYNLAEMIRGNQKNSEHSIVPFGFALQNIEIKDSRIIFSDRPTEKTHTIEKISLALPALATPDEDGTESPFLLSAKQSITPSFSAVINGSPVNLTGETNTATDTMEARFHLILNTIDLPQYLSYLPGTGDFTISKGQADLDLNLIMSQPTGSSLGMRIEGSGQFSDLWIKDGGGRTSRFPKTTINGSLAPFEGYYRFHKIDCRDPEIHLIREKNGSFILPGLPFPKKNNGARAGLHVDHFLLKKAKLSFIDYCVNGGFAETVAGIDMRLDFSKDKEVGTFSIRGQTKGGTTISSQGRLSFSPLQMTGRLDMAHLPLPAYSVYLGSCLPLPLKNGSAEKIKLSFSWEQDGKTSATSLKVTDLALDLQSLVLAEKDQEWLRLPKMTVTDGELSWLDKKISMGQTTLDEGFLLIHRDKEKQLNWKFRQEEPRHEKWEISLPHLAVSRSRLELVDSSRSVPQQMDVKEIAFQAENLTNQTNKQGSIEGQALLTDNGLLRFSGALGFNPWQAELDGRLEEISLTGVKPLLKGWLSPEVTSGTLTAEGAFQFPEHSFNGFAEIKNFAANDNFSRELLSWRLANSENIQLRLEPFSLKTPLINIDRGFLNWTESPDEPAFPARFSRSFPETWNQDNSINIEEIRLSNTTLSFHDRTVSPHFAMNFIVSGTMTDLGSKTDGKTDGKTKFSFQGRTDDKAPCNFDGETSFFDGRDVSLHAKIKGQPVAPFIPYLEKLFSHGVQGGIFDLDAVYRQKSGKVKMDSKIVLSGLEIGHPLRKNANLDLTRALLQDTAGRIHLHLFGSRDADEMPGSYHKILARELQNLRLKTAVSPFSLLPSPREGTETPADHLLFPFGEAALTKKAEKQLINLVSILKKRPELTIRLRGFADDTNDRRILLARLRKENVRKKMIRESTSLEKAARTYGQEEIHLSPKSSADAQAVKSVTVKKSDLLELARQRAAHVQDYLRRKLKIAPHRVILDDSDRVVPGHSIGRPASRVDLILGAS